MSATTLRRLRVPYRTTIGAHGAIELAVRYGRSIGLDVENHHDGGWLDRCGWIVAIGTPDALKRFKTYLRRLESM